MSDPIRLFVGVGANNEDLEAQAVLEFTARRYCTEPLTITWMRQTQSGPWSGWACSSGRTPFTHFRWSVPDACSYQGRAIYTDIDFFFLADLAELWRQPIPQVALVRNATGKLSTSCILFDCQRALPHVPPIAQLRTLADPHGQLLKYFRAHTELLSACEGNWDCPDLNGATLEDPTIKAVHFTRIETQLHLRYAIPRLQAEGRRHWYTGEVFTHPRPELVARYDELYAASQAAGYGIERYRVEPFDGATRRDFAYKHHIGAKR